MADVNNIVCLGLGSWSSVNNMPTLGYSIGVIVKKLPLTGTVLVKAYTAGSVKVKPLETATLGVKPQ